MKRPRGAWRKGLANMVRAERERPSRSATRCANLAAATSRTSASNIAFRARPPPTSRCSVRAWTSQTSLMFLVALCLLILAAAWLLVARPRRCTTRCSSMHSTSVRACSATRNCSVGRARRVPRPAARQGYAELASCERAAGEPATARRAEPSRRAWAAIGKARLWVAQCRRALGASGARASRSCVVRPRALRVAVAVRWNNISAARARPCAVIFLQRTGAGGS